MIIHLLKDRRDPLWQLFTGVDEWGRYKGNDTLVGWREVHGGPTHKGLHSTCKIPAEVYMYRDIEGVSIYWLEAKEA